MDNLISISNVKENILQFGINITGIETDDIIVRFVIEANEMELAFDSQRTNEENQWAVKIPALSILETTSYPFHIDVVVDGYYFEPMQGSISVVGSHEIYATRPENITLTPSKKKATAKTITQKAATKKEETSNVAKKLEPKKLEPKKLEKVNVEEPIKPIIKPNRKYKMEPLKVKDGKELFKTLTANKKPERKTDDGLDDKIVNLMKKSKIEQVPKKAAASVKKEETPKDTKEKQFPKITKKDAKDKPVENKKEVAVKGNLDAKKSKDVKKKSGAKSIAEKIIQSVTGLGTKKGTSTEKVKDDKIKEIIKEDMDSSKKIAAKKKAIPKKASGIKKITMEVDEAKEQNIKNALKEINSSDTKSIMTKPFNKKNITFH